MRTAGTRLQSASRPITLTRMTMPDGPLTLTPQQIEELNKKLSTMRHDVNNSLSLVAAVADLIKLDPSSATRRAATLSEQSGKIGEHLAKFTAAFDLALGIKRG